MKYQAAPSFSGMLQISNCFDQLSMHNAPREFSQIRLFIRAYVRRIGLENDTHRAVLGQRFHVEHGLSVLNF